MGGFAGTGFDVAGAGDVWRAEVRRKRDFAVFSLFIYAVLAGISAVCSRAVKILSPEHDGVSSRRPTGCRRCACGRAGPECLSMINQSCRRITAIAGHGACARIAAAAGSRVCMDRLGATLRFGRSVLPEEGPAGVNSRGSGCPRPRRGTCPARRNVVL